MIYETEKVSSLTFAGTQNSNMSYGGAMNNNKEVFIVFVNQHPLKPHQTKFEPHQTLIEPKFKPTFEPNIKPFSNLFKHNISFIFFDTRGTGFI